MLRDGLRWDLRGNPHCPRCRVALVNRSVRRMDEVNHSTLPLNVFTDADAMFCPECKTWLVPSNVAAFAPRPSARGIR